LRVLRPERGISSSAESCFPGAKIRRQCRQERGQTYAKVAIAEVKGQEIWTVFNGSIVLLKLQFPKKINSGQSRISSFYSNETDGQPSLLYIKFQTLILLPKSIPT
jgi:hypothetical protein